MFFAAQAQHVPESFNGGCFACKATAHANDSDGLRASWGRGEI